MVRDGAKDRRQAARAAAIARQLAFVPARVAGFRGWIACVVIPSSATRAGHSYNLMVENW
jgi:hypothetical protein